MGAKSELFTLKSDEDGVTILFKNEPFLSFNDRVRAIQAMFILTKQVEPMMSTSPVKD
jgi:hypothetical protein